MAVKLDFRAHVTGQRKLCPGACITGKRMWRGGAKLYGVRSGDGEEVLCGAGSKLIEPPQCPQSTERNSGMVCLPVVRNRRQSEQLTAYRD